MDNTKFMDITASVSQAIGQDNSIQVCFNDGAYTNGNVITLPSLPTEGTISYTDMMVMQGFRDHETLHVLCTQMSDERVKGKLQSLGSQELFDVVNNFEDIRIEHCAYQAYFGMRQNIAAMNNKVFTALLEKVEQEMNKRGNKGSKIEDFFDTINYANLIVNGRAREKVGYAYDRSFDVYQDANQGWKDFADKWSDIVLGVDTGWTGKEINKDRSLLGFFNVCEVAEEFLKDLKAKTTPRNQQQQQSPNQQQSQQQQGQAGLSNGNSGGQQSDNDGEDGDEDQQQSEPNNNQPGDSSSDQRPGDDPQSSMHSKPGGNELTQGSGNANAPKNKKFKFDLTEEQQDACKDIAKDNSDANGSKKHSSYVGSYYVWSAKVWYDNEKEYNRLKALVLDDSKADVLKAKRGLEISLQAKADVDMTTGQTRGKLDGKRLVEAVSGSPYVYRNRKDGKDIDTSICFLLDVSGSMTNIDLTEEEMRRINAQAVDDGDEYDRFSRIAIASRVTYILCKAAENVGCSTEILAFESRCTRIVMQPGEDMYSDGSATVLEASTFRNKRNRYKEGYEYNDSMYVLLSMKTKNERIEDTKVRSRLASSRNYLGGNTPLGEAVEICLTRMLNDPAKKKILVVLTDGELYEYQSKYVKKTLEPFAKKNHIHMLGVGINADISAAFTDSITTRGGNLSNPLINKMAKIIAEE